MTFPSRTLVTLALFFSLFSGLAFALSAEEAARFYLKSGETFKTEQVKLDGTTYFVMKINDEPSVVLGPNEVGYAAVTDSAKLDTILKAYAAQSFEARNWTKSLDILNASGSLVDLKVGDCVEGGKTFLKNIPTRIIRIGSANLGLYFLISRSREGLYKQEYDAIQSFNKSFPSFDAAYAQFSEKKISLKSAIDSENAEASLEATGVIRDSSGNLKKEYTTITSAYAALGASKDFATVLKYTFYYQGTPHSCAFDANVTAALTSLESEFSDKALQSPAQLKTSILTKTADREASANKETAYAVRQEKYDALSARIANTTKLYDGASPKPTFTALTSEQARMTSSLNALKSGTNGTAATEFDTTSTKVESDLGQYQKLSTEFKAAAKALAEAEANFSSALKRYGEADPRMESFKKQLDGIKQSMTQNMLALQSADFAKARFDNVTSTARDFAYTTGSLQPKESEIDPVIIGAVVVLLLGLAGTVYYFRKMKGGGSEGLRKEATLSEKK